MCPINELTPTAEKKYGTGIITERQLLSNIIRYKVLVHDETLLVDYLNTSKDKLFTVGETVNIHIQQEQICSLN